MPSDNSRRLLDLTAEIVSAYVSRNPVQSVHLSELITDIHGTLAGFGGGAAAAPRPAEPAVDPAKSITPDFLICLEDGRKLKMLKRHLRSRFDMSPAEYRHKWRLPADYPMVAPNYAKKRSEFAKKIGLGRHSVKAAS